MKNKNKTQKFNVFYSSFVWCPLVSENASFQERLVSFRKNHHLMLDNLFMNLNDSS